MWKPCLAPAVETWHGVASSLRLIKAARPPALSRRDSVLRAQKQEEAGVITGDGVTESKNRNSVDFLASGHRRRVRGCKEKHAAARPVDRYN